MKKKIIVATLFLFAAVAMAFGLLACNTNTSEYNDSGNITGTDGSDTDGAEGSGGSDSDESGTPGVMYYALNNDKESYSVGGYGGDFGGDVEIPETYENFPVTSILPYAFYGCTSLTSVVLPNSITSVGISAFSGCTSLVNVTIGEKVTYIGDSAFSGCSSLESLTLPFVGERTAAAGADPTTLFGYIFGTDSYSGSSAVEQFYRDTYYVNYSVTYYIPTSLTSVTITSKEILPGAFNNCDMISSIILGDEVTSVGDYAFYDCTSLASVVIDSSVSKIGGYAFCNCSSLVSVTICDGVKSIGSYAFYNCTSLTSVYFLGTSSEWSEITIGDNNSWLKDDATIYYYSEKEPDYDDEYNYWYYDVYGEIVVWVKE